MREEVQKLSTLMEDGGLVAGYRALLLSPGGTNGKETSDCEHLLVVFATKAEEASTTLHSPCN